MLTTNNSARYSPNQVKAVVKVPNCSLIKSSVSQLAYAPYRRNKGIQKAKCSFRSPPDIRLHIYRFGQYDAGFYRLVYYLELVAIGVAVGDSFPGDPKNDSCQLFS